MNFMNLVTIYKRKAKYIAPFRLLYPYWAISEYSEWYVHT